MSRSAGIVLACSVVLGVTAFLVFNAAWEGGADHGWGLRVRDHPVLHALGIALGVVWLGVFSWGLTLLARVLRPALPMLAGLAIVLTGIGAAAGLVVAGFQVYLLVVVGSTVRDDAFIDTLLRVLDLEGTYLTFAAVAILALAAALSALAYGAARTGRGSRAAGWAVAGLVVPALFVDWIAIAYPAALLLFGLSLVRGDSPT